MEKVALLKPSESYVASPVIDPGDIVQICPMSMPGKVYGPQLVIVESAQLRCVLGYFIAFNDSGRSQRHNVVVKHADYRRVGRATWVLNEKGAQG